MDYNDIDVSSYPLATASLFYKLIVYKDKSFKMAQNLIKNNEYEDIAEYDYEYKQRLCLALVNKWIFDCGKKGLKIKDEWLLERAVMPEEIALCKAYIQREFADKEKLYMAVVNACAEAYYFIEAFTRDEDEMQPRGEDLEYYAFEMYPFFKMIGIEIGHIESEVDSDDPEVIYSSFKFNKEFENWQNRYAKRCDEKAAESIYVIKANERKSGNCLIYFDNTLLCCDPIASGEVKVKNGTYAIGENAFADCGGIENIVFNTELEIIKKGAFKNCIGLRKVEIPDLVTEIGDAAFLNCERLKSIKFAEFATIGRSVCSGCVSLENVVFPKKIVKISDNMFMNSGVKEIVIPDGVRCIGAYAFADCESLKEITLPSSLDVVCESAFKRCTSLKEITFPQLFYKVEEEALKGCTSLKKVSLGGVNVIGDNLLADTNGVEEINFAGDEDEWEYVKFGENWDNHNKYKLNIGNELCW